jgi:hypothetical protein
MRSATASPTDAVARRHTWLHKKNAADNNKATLILALSLPNRCTHHTSPPQEASITASHVVWVWADYENRACARLKI